MNQKINDINELNIVAKEVRKRILKTAPLGFGAHVPSALSSADLVTALYFHTMNYDPSNTKWAERDRFILSAGHKCLVQYAALNLLGIISDEELLTWESFKSNLAGHPCYGKCPGVEASTGSLGHGFAISNGIALAAKIDGLSSRVFTILGDGELAEGSNWEAAMFASKYKLDNLVAIADCNNMSTVYPLSDSMPLLDLKAKFESFGFAVREINGNCMDEVVAALDAVPFVKGKPSAIVANCTKGCSVSSICNKPQYHAAMWNAEMVQNALCELEDYCSARLGKNM